MRPDANGTALGMQHDVQMGERWGHQIVTLFRETARRLVTGIPGVAALFKALADAGAAAMEHSADLVGNVFDVMAEMEAGLGLDDG